MTDRRARGVTGWGAGGADAGRFGRAGFVLGRYGMTSWPLERPYGLLYGYSPSGFTEAGGSYSAWDDAITALDLTATGAHKPTAGAINDHPAGVYSRAASSYFTRGGNPFSALTEGEVWIVARSNDWEGPLGTILLAITTTPTSEPQINFRVYGPAAIYGAARRMNYGFAPGSGPGTAFSGYGDTTLADDTTYVLRWASDGSTVSMFVNGLQQAITTDLGTNQGQWFSQAPAASYTLGQYLPDPQYGHDGELALHMVLPKKLSTSGAAQWDRFFCRAFGAAYLG